MFIRSEDVAVKRIIISGIIAGVLGVLLHMFIGTRVGAYVTRIMTDREIVVLMPPYPSHVNALAFATSVIPGIGTAIAFYLIESNLPGKGVIQKGIIFGLLFMLMRGTLIRAPLMDLTVGNPIMVVLLQRFEPFATGLCMALVISAIVKKGKRTPAPAIPLDG